MQGPLILQSDYTMMLEVQHPQFAECRDFLTTFAELVKSPEFIHTYKITPLSLWNAAALGIAIEELSQGLANYSRYDIPPNVSVSIDEWYAAYGKLVLQPAGNDHLHLKVNRPALKERLLHEETLQPFWTEFRDDGFHIEKSQRGNLKHALVKIGFPVKDICGYASGDELSINLLDRDRDGNDFSLYDYQTEAVEAFYHAGRASGGNGIIVLPCGSGKTIIGLGTLAGISNHTLIITTNNVSVHQWRDELLSKTDVDPGVIGEYTGMGKEIKPVTITTYQMLTHRKSKAAPFPHLELFTTHNWGLIIYDEVHLLPAPVFRATVGIQTRRRLGLTATLVREDGKEDEVFALIGPKRYDVPWKVLENKGYIAEAYCTEYRIPLQEQEELDYAYAPKRQRFRIAAENSRKPKLVKELIENHPDDKILVIGQYISQVEDIAQQLKAPLITGKVKHDERKKLYDAFNQGTFQTLVVSKVANFAVDLPDANILIQISGTYGSRQEEAQRLGRILRPKKRKSHFYTLVSQGTDEQDFGLKRQLFLVEQGYKYEIRYFD
ncbi:MAG: DEAD/DEAH box helicase [Proteobacteria bacterium]|nr:DEAD/DEAH box helicase [Pseudomonadota bacterium]